MSVQLLYGDCLEIMPTLPQDSVQMVFADLPYGGRHRKTTDCEWDRQISLDSFWAYTRRFNSAIIATATQPFASMLVSSNLKQFSYDLIWHKSNIGGWFNANRAPLRAHEHVLVFLANKSAYNPQKLDGKPYAATRSGVSKAFRERNLRGCTKAVATINSDGKRYPVSVQKFNRCTEKIVHPTQKPVALLQWIIKTYTNPGDTVLDPVMGSGTTGVACLRTGRKFIGIEHDADYFAVSKKRIADEQAQIRLAI